MPSLPQALREAADNADPGSGDFKVLDPGVYTARLSKVEARPTRDGKPMWALEFDTVCDLEGTKQPGRQWSNMTLEESTSWKHAQFFDAFGAPKSTDTDELINARLRLEISQRVVPFGKNAGKLGNNVDRFSPLVEGDAGYDKAQQLSTRLSGKKAPAARAPKPAAASAEDAAIALPEPQPDDLDF